MAYTTINDAGSFYNNLLYTGNSSTNAITGLGFQPDFVWIKAEDAASRSHVLTNVPRGTDSQSYCNETTLPSTQTDALTSFDSDGFTLGANATDGEVNESSDTFVGWCWKGGTTSGIATNGSTTITPSAYSFNQTSGFSVSNYVGNKTSGARVAHGLGATPDFFFLKTDEAGQPWITWHKDLTTPAEDYMTGLNSTAGELTGTFAWNDESPDSVNFVLGNNDQNNGSGVNTLAYCFTSIQGFSKFGAYTGNGNADGTFVYTGFRPAYVMIKAFSLASGNSWNIYDDKRPSTYEGNVVTELLEADTGNATLTSSSFNIDLLSNGFKCRGNESGINQNAAEYIFAAFAKNPLVNSEGVPSNAR